MHPAFTRLRAYARDALTGGVTLAHLRFGRAPIELLIQLRIAPSIPVPPR